MFHITDVKTVIYTVYSGNKLSPKRVTKNNQGLDASNTLNELI